MGFITDTQKNKDTNMAQWIQNITLWAETCLLSPAVCSVFSGKHNSFFSDLLNDLLDSVETRIAVINCFCK